jgi:hypothetical protein
VDERLKLEIRTLPWSIVLIAAALEGVTVSILPYAATLQPEHLSKPPEAGLLLGYIGMLTAILLANIVNRGLSADRSFRIRKPFIVSLWGGAFLAMIFLFQGVFRFSPDNTLNVMLRAACSLACSTLILLFVYRWVVRKVPALAIEFTWQRSVQRIVDTSMWPPVVYLAVYEAIALPIIEIVRNVDQYRFLAGLLLGLSAGALAGAVVVAIYNALSRSCLRTRLALIVEREA